MRSQNEVRHPSEWTDEWTLDELDADIANPNVHFTPVFLIRDVHLENIKNKIQTKNHVIEWKRNISW